MITKMVRCVTAKGTEIRLATPQSPLSLSHTHPPTPTRTYPPRIFRVCACVMVPFLFRPCVRKPAGRKIKKGPTPFIIITIAATGRRAETFMRR